MSLILVSNRKLNNGAWIKKTSMKTIGVSALFKYLQLLLFFLHEKHFSELQQLKQSATPALKIRQLNQKIGYNL